MRGQCQHHGTGGRGQALRLGPGCRGMLNTWLRMHPLNLAVSNPPAPLSPTSSRCRYSTAKMAHSSISMRARRECGTGGEYVLQTYSTTNRREAATWRYCSPRATVL